MAMRNQSQQGHPLVELKIHMSNKWYGKYIQPTTYNFFYKDKLVVGNAGDGSTHV